MQRRMHEIDPELIVIMMTGYASVETAVAALKNGAYDYVTKPLDPDEIAHLVKKALAHKRDRAGERAPAGDGRRGRAARGHHWPKRRHEEGLRCDRDGRAHRCHRADHRRKRHRQGTGGARHPCMPARGAFIRWWSIHCGALTETLLESELFGHEKGAFTGAQYRKKGKFEIAEGGTVFLDEIGDISLKTQTDLLRVLQEREIVRVGGNQPIKVDFRCVAATNKNLETLIEEGNFRPDLYYRLNVFRIELPPLRDRREDIPLLVNHFVRKFSLQMNKKITRVSPAAMNLLQQQTWPGNVRELENAVERAMVVAQEPEIRERILPSKPSVASQRQRPKSLEEIEKAHILRVLEQCSWNQTRAAEILDIDRVTLHHKMKRYGWSKPTCRNAMKVLQLLPIGEFDGRLLRELAPAMADMFRVPCEVLRAAAGSGVRLPRRTATVSTLLRSCRPCRATSSADHWRLLGSLRSTSTFRS